MNTSDPRNVAVAKYFKPSIPKPSYSGEIIWLILGSAVAVLVLLSGNSDSSLFAVIGGIVALFALGAIMTKSSDYNKLTKDSEPKPSDKQMDRWLEQDKKRIIATAMDNLGLIPEQTLNAKDPLVIIGPKSPTMLEIGDDGIIRFSNYQIVVIFLTDYHLGGHTCNLNFINGSVSREETQEYHYTDVVSVATLHSNSDFTATTVDGKEHPIRDQQQFSLSVASGESIKVTVAFPQVEGILKEGKLLPTGAEKAISTIRAMLRDKKGGVRAR